MFKPRILLFLCVIILISCNHESSDDHHDEDDHEHAITLTPEQASLFGVTTGRLEPSKFHEIIKTSGTIEASGSDIFTVSAKKSGIVTLASDINTGTMVKNGEHIASISSDGIQGGDINRAATVNLDAARKEYERLEPLYKDGLVTGAVFREAERIYKEAEALAGIKNSTGSSLVISPTDGTIRSLNVKSGDYVETGTPIATVAKNQQLKLRADVPVRKAMTVPSVISANFIPEGGKLLKLSELSGKKISGDLSTPENGYIPVYFTFSGNSLVSPGGYAEVFLICNEKENVMVVPKDALIEIQGNTYLYVMEDEHGYEKRLVETGGSDGELVEIISGVHPGENIVTRGASIVRMAEVSAIAPPAHNHSH